VGDIALRVPLYLELPDLLFQPLDRAAQVTVAPSNSRID